MKSVRKKRAAVVAEPVSDTPALTTFSSDLLTPEEERELLAAFWDCKSELVRILLRQHRPAPAMLDGVPPAGAQEVLRRRAGALRQTALFTTVAEALASPHGEIWRPGASAPCLPASWCSWRSASPA